MICMRCGKEMANTTGGNHNCPHCGFSVNDLVYRSNACDMPVPQGFGSQGWTCPVCGRGLAPWISMCPCMSKNLEITYGTTTTVSDDAEKELNRLFALNDERVAEMIRFKEEWGTED